MDSWGILEEATENDLRAVLLFQPPGDNYTYTPFQQILQEYIFEHFSFEEMKRMIDSIIHKLMHLQKSAILISTDHSEHSL